MPNCTRPDTWSKFCRPRSESPMTDTNNSFLSSFQDEDLQRAN